MTTSKYMKRWEMQVILKRIRKRNKLKQATTMNSLKTLHKISQIIKVIFRSSMQMLQILISKKKSSMKKYRK